MFAFRLETDCRNKRFPGQDSEIVKSLMVKVQRKLKGFGYNCQKHVYFHVTEVVREKQKQKKWAK